MRVRALDIIKNEFGQYVRLPETMVKTVKTSIGEKINIARTDERVLPEYHLLGAIGGI